MWWIVAAVVLVAAGVGLARLARHVVIPEDDPHAGDTPERTARLASVSLARTRTRTRE